MLLTIGWSIMKVLRVEERVILLVFFVCTSTLVYSDEDDLEEGLRSPIDAVKDLGGMEIPAREFLLKSHPIARQLISSFRECGINWQDYFVKNNLTTDKILTRQKRVVAVKESAVSVLKYPWMAQLYIKHLESNHISFQCGATLISQKVLLTAAHCLTRLPAGYTVYAIVMGISERDAYKTCDPMEECQPKGMFRFVFGIEIHPRYSEGSLEHDVGLIYLKNEITYNPFVRPICLPLTDALLEKWETSELQVPGWGAVGDTVDRGPTTPSRVLRDITVHVRPRSLCDRFFGVTYGMLGSNRFCILGSVGNSPCSGDSGGPYIKFMPVPVVNNENRWVQFGIVSGGGHHPHTCGEQGKPSISTNVLFYMHWILDRIQNTLFPERGELPRHDLLGKPVRVGAGEQIPERMNLKELSKVEHKTPYHKIDFKKELGSGRSMNVMMHPNVKLLASFDECGVIPLQDGKHKMRTISYELGSPTVPTPPHTSPAPENSGSQSEESSEEITAGVKARRRKRMVGATGTRMDGYFPWMAQVLYRDENTLLEVFRCGGVIITKRHILTSATCVTALPFPFVLGSVVVGQYNRLTVMECVDGECFRPSYHNIEKFDVHPGFESHVFSNDLAVITLAEELKFTKMVRPICFPRKESLINEIKLNRFFVSGWGKFTSSPANDRTGNYSNILLKMEVGLLNRSDCNAVYTRSLDRAYGNRICGGGQSFRGECLGDHGGPLVKKFQPKESPRLANLHFLVGLVSYSECGNSGMPSVYTNIFYHLHWILDQLGPVDDHIEKFL